MDFTRPERCRRQRTGREDRRSKFYEIADNLKRCYNSGNFAAKHLGPLRGFNAGSNRTEIVLTSKWIDDFAAAVKTAHGDSEED